MTARPVLSAAVDVDVHATVTGRLRVIGQRYTSGRRRLVDALGSGDGPASIAALSARADDLPQSSIYRNLAVLEEAGCVHRLPAGHGSALFELAEDLTGHHHHLVCTSCGDVVDFQVTPALERSLGRAVEEVSRSAGFQVEGHRLDLVGLCSGCSQLGRSPVTPSTR